MDTIRKLPTQVITLSCTNKMITSGVVGVTIAWTGARFPTPLKLPAVAHMAVGGVLVDLLCQAHELANGFANMTKHAVYAGIAGGATLLLTGTKPAKLLMM